MTQWRAYSHIFLRMLVGVVLGLAIAVLFAFNALLLWVATGPRSLDTLSPYIEAAFEPTDHQYSVMIGETWLIWDGWKHPIDLRLRNVTVLAKGQRFSTFSEISLGVDVVALLWGRILPTSITITHPIIKLVQSDDYSINFGFHMEMPTVSETETTIAEEGAVPFAAVIAPLVNPESDGRLRKLSLITIHDADIGVYNKRKALFFNAVGTDIIFKRKPSGDIETLSNTKIVYGDYQSQVDSHFAFNKNESLIRGELNINQLMPGVLAGLFFSDKSLGALKLPVTGKTNITFGLDGSLHQLYFMLDAGKGTINTDYLSGVLQVNALHAEGQFSHNFTELAIKQLTADLDGMLVSAQGTGSWRDGDAAIRADATFNNIPASRVALLWPPTLAPESRQWIITNISEGMVPKAETHVNIVSGDLAKPLLPKEAVNATIALNDATIRYLPEHPEVHSVKGSIYVDALSLEANIDSASYMKETRLSAGKLWIEDLNADNPYIKLHFDAESTAKEIVRFLGLPRLKHAERLSLHEESAQGSVKGHASLGFHFFTPRDEKGHPVGDSDITYDIAADVTGITQPGFMKKFDIKNADGNFTVKNEGLEFKGKGEVNDATVPTAHIKYLFTPEKGLDTFMKIEAIAPVTSLLKFGYPEFPFLKGTLGVKADIQLGDTLELSEASFDLARTAVTLPSLGWTKPDQEPATLNMTAEKKAGVVTIPSFHIKGSDMDAKGSAELNKELSDIQKVRMEKLHYGSTDLEQFLYELIDGGFRLEAKGKSADVTPWMEKDEKDGGGFSFEHFPAVQFKGDIERVVMGKGGELFDVKGELMCDGQRCNNADVTGSTADNKKFSFSIDRGAKGKRQLSVHAENAGAFLKAAHVIDGMEGGELSINGMYDDNTASSVLRGRLDITDHVIKDAPILARLLSLASLTGFFDTLQGKGIRFTKLATLFTIANDVITLEKGKTHGDAIGMTVDGTITFPKKILDLQGTIVPSYTLNNVLGKVPLVGNMLTGGEGQGVFAARYTVQGSEKTPEVKVNPLSILTPGFLRGLFDILDKPAKKDVPKEQSKEEE